MKQFLPVIMLFHWGYGLFPGATPDEGDYRHIYPIVSLAIHLNNEAHLLPYLFGLIENLDYPKDRISLDITVEKSVDRTHENVLRWNAQVKQFYRSTEIVTDADNWREEALTRARNGGYRFLFIAKGDHILTDSRIIQHLISKKKVIISPLLFGPFGFNGSIFISEEYNTRNEVSAMQVNDVVEPMLIDLAHQDSSYLTFHWENLPFYSTEQLSTDPLFVLSVSASRMNIPVFIDNEVFYGYFLNLSQYSLEYSKKMLRYFIADLISDYGLIPFMHSSFVAPTYPARSLFGADKIYLINLERRKDRRYKMENIFKLMGVEYTYWQATDGNNLKDDDIAKGITLLPGYEDPYYKRPMKAGEIGCFLSHYRIWQDVVDKSLKRVIVFEDDLRFIVNSTIILEELIEDVDRNRIDWDLIYLGRKRLEGTNEVWVPGIRHLSTVGYSYWTLGYMLSQRGARKLLDGEPLKKLIPVDEYIPIMFDEHPNATWKDAFPIRDLIAYTVYPTIVVPERYTNEYGYVSDTEDSVVVAESFDTTGTDQLLDNHFSDRHPYLGASESRDEL